MTYFDQLHSPRIEQFSSQVKATGFALGEFVVIAVFYDLGLVCGVESEKRRELRDSDE